MSATNWSSTIYSRTVVGWSEPAPPHQWDLHAPDVDLTRSFLAWINEQRVKQRIISFLIPKQSRAGKHRSHNRGNRHRKMSWRWPEVMDIHRFGTRSLTDSERSIKSDAEEEALKWKPRFLSSLSWVALRPFSTPESWRFSAEFPKSWLQENFNRWYPAKARESLQK